MANPNHLKHLLRGPECWNQWRAANPDIKPDLSGIDIRDQRFKASVVYVEEDDFLRISSYKCLVADLSRYNLSKVYLQESCLIATNIRGAHLEGANLRKAHLEGADLSETHLEGAVLMEAHLEGAVLIAAHMEAAILWGAHMEDARLIEAHLERAKLMRAHLEGANLWRVHLEGAKLMRAHLEGAELMGAHLEGADLLSANFKDANITAVSFDRNGWYQGIRLSGAHGSQRFIRHAKDQDYIEEFRGRNLLFNSNWANFFFIPYMFALYALYVLLCSAPYWLLRFFKRNPGFCREYELDVRWAAYLGWLIFSDCGRSFTLWLGWSLAMAYGFAHAFHSLGPGAFHLISDNGKALQWGLDTMLYYSVVTFTTLGFGDVTPITSAAKHWVMAEVAMGYLMLGGLISIFANKLARRSG